MTKRRCGPSAISAACFAFFGLSAVFQLDYAFAHEFGLHRVLLGARVEPLDYFAQRSYFQVSLRKFAFQRALANASLLECAFQYALANAFFFSFPLHVSADLRAVCYERRRN